MASAFLFILWSATSTCLGWLLSTVGDVMNKATDRRARALQEDSCPPDMYDKSFGNMKIGWRCGYKCPGGPKTNFCCECACVSALEYKLHIMKYGERDKDKCNTNTSTPTEAPTPAKIRFSASSTTTTFPMFIRLSTTTTTPFEMAVYESSALELSHSGERGIESNGWTSKVLTIAIVCLVVFVCCTICFVGCCVREITKRKVVPADDSTIKPSLLQLQRLPAFVDPPPEPPPQLPVELDPTLGVKPQPPKILGWLPPPPNGEPQQLLAAVSSVPISEKGSIRQVTMSCCVATSEQSTSERDKMRRTKSKKERFPAKDSRRGWASSEAPQLCRLPPSSSRPPSHRWRVVNYIE